MDKLFQDDVASWTSLNIPKLDCTFGVTSGHGFATQEFTSNGFA